MAGYSGTPLPKKLGIKEGHRVAQLGGPEGFRAGLDLHPSVRVDGELEVALEQDELLPHRWDIVHQERGVKIGERRSAAPPVTGESFDFEGETYEIVDFQNYPDRRSRVTVQPQQT